MALIRTTELMPLQRAVIGKALLTGEASCWLHQIRRLRNIWGKIIGRFFSTGILRVVLGDHWDDGGFDLIATRWTQR